MVQRDGADADSGARAGADWIAHNAYVVPPLRLVYVDNPKAACTTVKWALAEAVASPGPRNAPTERARVSFSREPTRELTIHDPMVHGLQLLSTVPTAEREAMLESPDWVRFSVVRDPYERLLSGWVDRVLIGRASRHDAWRDPLAAGPDDAPGPRDLGRVFREFVLSLQAEAAPILADRHFSPQASLLDPTRFPYTHLVHTRELEAFRLELVASDPARSGLVFGRMNAGIRVRADELYDRETAGIVEAVYREDFIAFGFPRREFPVAADPVPLSVNKVAMLQMVRDRDERISDLAALARAAAAWSPPRRGLRGRLRLRREG